MQVNRSGSIANGPSPEPLKPATLTRSGFDTREYNSSANENTSNPKENSRPVSR
ncbi:hypothetical protein MUP51_04365 [Candidatus Bathyarchaeota archaeon]|nr:hypothetical protein [Candidatus Bathyarchaeota archaeon]